jgi:hypothetical protein
MEQDARTRMLRRVNRLCKEIEEACIQHESNGPIVLSALEEILAKIKPERPKKPTTKKPPTNTTSATSTSLKPKRPPSRLSPLDRSTSSDQMISPKVRTFESMKLMVVECIFGELEVSRHLYEECRARTWRQR